MCLSPPVLVCVCSDKSSAVGLCVLTAYKQVLKWELSSALK